MFTAAKLVAIAIIIGGGLYMIGIGKHLCTDLEKNTQCNVVRYLFHYQGIHNTWNRDSRTRPPHSETLPQLFTLGSGRTMAGEYKILEPSRPKNKKINFNFMTGIT